MQLDPLPDPILPWPSEELAAPQILRPPPTIAEVLAPEDGVEVVGLRGQPVLDEGMRIGCERRQEIPFQFGGLD